MGLLNRMLETAGYHGRRCVMTRHLGGRVQRAGELMGEGGHRIDAMPPNLGIEISVYCFLQSENLEGPIAA